jgi:prephenate dehydratase
MKLYALGPHGSNGHLAATRLCAREKPLSPEQIVLCDSHTAVFKKLLLDKDKESKIIVPVENSITGLVGEVVNGFWLNDAVPDRFQVLDEIVVPIKHCLCLHKSQSSRPSDIKAMHTVMSHPQALDQCSDYLDTMGFPNRIPMTSTSAAAEQLRHDESFRDTETAVIASEFAAHAYGLKVVRKNIGNYPNNQTRFNLIGRKNKGLAVKMGYNVRDKTSLIFWVRDQPRELLNVLWCIGIGDVNISSIHSIPTGTLGEYVFYCEFDRHQKSKRGEKILDRIRTVARRIFILGSFPIDAQQ